MDRRLAINEEGKAMRLLKVLGIVIWFLNPFTIKALMRDGATEEELDDELTNEEDISFVLTLLHIFMQPDSDLASDVCPAYHPASGRAFDSVN